MASEQPTPFQTFSRLAIMLGTLSCGSLAAWHYKPKPGQLAEMIDSTAAMVIGVPEPETTAQEGAGVAPAFGSTAGSAPDAPQSVDQADTPRWDSAVQQASAFAPVERTAPVAAPAQLDTLERERLTAPALAAGAIRADVQPWGSGEQSLYRATAAASTGAAGLQRRLDAYGATPEAAVASLVDELREIARR